MIHFILFSILSMMTLRAADARNVEGLSLAETKQWLALKSMQWQRRRPSEAEIEQVAEGLGSPKHAIADAAIGVAILHRLREVLPVLERGVVTSRGYRNELSRGVAEAFKVDGNPVIYLRDMASRLPAAATRGPVRDVTTTLDAMTDLVVIEKAKAIRAGEIETIDLQDLELTDLQRKILDYSKLPEREAVEDIIRKLSGAKIAGREEYEYVEVLNSYGYAVVGEVIDGLERLTDDPDASEYSKILLLAALGPFTYRMEPADFERMRGVLSRLEESENQTLINKANTFRKLLEQWGRAPSVDRDGPGEGNAGPICILHSVRPVAPGGGAGRPSRVVAYGLRYDDLGRVLAAVPTIRRAAPVREFPREIRRGDRAIEGRIVATTADYAGIVPIEAGRGRFLTEPDNTHYENVAVLGAEAARLLFPGEDEDPIGQPIRLGTDDYAIVGVLERWVRTPDTPIEWNPDQGVFIPLNTGRIRFGERILVRRPGLGMVTENTQLSRIIVQLDEGASVERAASLIESAIAPFHPNGDFRVSTTDR